LAYARDVTEALPASLLLAANGAVSLGPEHRGIPHGGAMTNRTADIEDVVEGNIYDHEGAD
jgi:hypothetical protein